MNTSIRYLVLSETMGFFCSGRGLLLQTIEASVCRNRLLLQAIGLSTYRCLLLLQTIEAFTYRNRLLLRTVEYSTYRRFLLFQTIRAFIYRNRLLLRTVKHSTYSRFLLLQTIRAFTYRSRLLSETIGDWRTKQRLRPEDLGQTKREEMMPSDTKKASSVRRMVSAGSCRRTRRPEAM